MLRVIDACRQRVDPSASRTLRHPSIALAFEHIETAVMASCAVLSWSVGVSAPVIRT